MGFPVMASDRRCFECSEDRPAHLADVWSVQNIELRIMISYCRYIFINILYVVL